MRPSAFVLAEEFRPTGERDPRGRYYCSVSSGKKLNSVYSVKFLDNYLVSDYFKAPLYGVRPVKLKRRVLFSELDHLFESRFKIEILEIRKSGNAKSKKAHLVRFSKFVYQTYAKRYSGNHGMAEKKLIALLYSVDQEAPRSKYVALFVDFVNDCFDAVELKCFLLLR